MKVFKHVISTITLISLILVIYAALSIEKDSGMIKALLFSTYSIFTFFVLLTYRVSLIGKEKINWVALGLTGAISLSLFLMESDKGLVYSLWDFTLVGFILLCGEAIFQIIPKKRPLSLATKILTISILALFTSIVAFQIGSSTLFYIAEWLMILLSLLLIVNFFLKTKKA
jgi:hypothetical protein